MSKIITALAVILLGLYFLLDSLHLISRGMLSVFDDSYSLLAIVFGLLLIAVPLFEHKRPHFFWGLFFLIYGGLMFADHANMLVFQWTDFWKLWPYLIIYFGLAMLFGGNRYFPWAEHMEQIHERHRRRHASDRRFDDVHHAGGSAQAKDYYQFATESKFQHENWMAKSMDERVRIGDYTFDFTKAFIPEETVRIRLSGWVGNIRITMPDDLAYRVYLRARVGDAKISDNKQSGVLRDVHYQTPDYDTAVRKIDFYFNFQVIDLKIAQV